MKHGKKHRKYINSAGEQQCILCAQFTPSPHGIRLMSRTKVITKGKDGKGVQ